MILSKIQEKYINNKINTIDGVKIDFDEGWVHLRKSNTEPIIRIYTESLSKEKADSLAITFIEEINNLI
jgi:phosphomannomutase